MLRESMIKIRHQSSRPHKDVGLCLISKRCSLKVKEWHGHRFIPSFFHVFELFFLSLAQICTWPPCSWEEFPAQLNCLWSQTLREPCWIEEMSTENKDGMCIRRVACVSVHVRYADIEARRKPWCFYSCVFMQMIHLHILMWKQCSNDFTASCILLKVGAG